MQKVTNMNTYRHTNAAFISENVASNLLVMVSVDVPADMAGIAMAVRDARVQSREPYYIHTLGMLTSKIMLDSANAGRPPPFLADDNQLVVNSHANIDWHSAHFGYPDETRFFMSRMDRYYLIISKSNPVRGGDGVWRRARPSVDISLGVPAKLKPQIMETLAQGVQYMLTGNYSEHARL